MTAANEPMKRLYHKLQTVGYPKQYIHSLLPNWWDDAIANTPAGFQQASLMLGRLFCVQPETLWTQDAPAALVTPDGRKFKQRADTKPDELELACALALSAARLALKAFKPEYHGGFHPDSAELRQRLLAGKPWIGFQDLLGHCLATGIPVIFLNHFPRKAKKMAGVSFEHGGRPVIVLTQNKPPGYLSFDLAHELGHVTLGHTQGGAWVIDAKIDADAEGEEEQAANRFALELITGNPDCKIVPRGRHLYPPQLANAAIRHGESNQSDPLHIALNYGHTQAQWAVATQAVKLIAHGKPADQQILVQALLDSLDLDAMQEDDLAALKQLLGEVGA